MNSRKAAVRKRNPGRGRKLVPRTPSVRTPRWRIAPTDGAPCRRDDPEAFRAEDRPDDDPGRVEDRRQRVEQETSVGDEDLAKTDRRREQDLRQTVDPQEVDVEVARGLVEACADRRRQPGCGEQDHDHRDDHHQDRGGQDGAPEVVRGALVVTAKGRVDRHERRRQASGDEDVERDLGDAERGVVRVELGPRTEGVGEDAVPHDPGDEVDEAQEREQQRAAWEDPVDERARQRHGRSRHGRPPTPAARAASWPV